jgi:large subunit ribosomal protein L1
VGKFSFAENALADNGRAVIEAIVRARPSGAKGTFIESATLSGTFTPGIRVDVNPFLQN